MTREDLLLQLKQYQASDDHQLQMQRWISEFVLNDENCFNRNNFYGHITASAWVIDQHNEKALLTLHRKLKLWLQPGGHADNDADVLAVAQREVAEECGLTHLQTIGGIFDLDVHTIPAIGNDPSHYHFDIRYLLQLQSAQPIVMSDESLDLIWYRPEEIYHINTDASVIRLCQKWQKLKQGECCAREKQHGN